MAMPMNRPYATPSTNLADGQGQPCMTFYIFRPNTRTYTPLLPADELPVPIESVPRALSLDHVMSMTCAGFADFTGKTFKIQSEGSMRQQHFGEPSGQFYGFVQSPGEAPRFQVSDLMARQGALNTNNSVTPKQQSAAEQSAGWRKGAFGPPQLVVGAIGGSAPITEVTSEAGFSPRALPLLPPSGHVPNQVKKEYCTHWIRHGECDYMQQGCLYKHEMPDMAKLTEIGFRGIPRWWLEKTACRSPAAVNAGIAKWMKPRNADGAVEQASPTNPTLSSTTKATIRGPKQDCPGAITLSTDVGSVQTVSATKVTSIEERIEEDLIDFKPLVPSLAASISSSTALDASTDVATPAKKQPGLLTGFGAESNTTAFVPAGESKHFQIAQLKMNVPRKQAATPHASTEKAICKSEKPIKAREQYSTNDGIMASRWAKAVDAPKPVAKAGRADARAPKHDHRASRRLPRPPRSLSASSTISTEGKAALKA